MLYCIYFCEYCKYLKNPSKYSTNKMEMYLSPAFSSYLRISSLKRRILMND